MTDIEEKISIDAMIDVFAEESHELTEQVALALWKVVESRNKNGQHTPTGMLAFSLIQILIRSDEGKNADWWPDFLSELIYYHFIKTPIQEDSNG